MHKLFRGFYTPKEKDVEEIWKDEKTIFIFDTNTLFNLYRCEEQTRKDLLNVMRNLSSRSWFPFQVYYEYQRNRKDVISESLKNLETLKKTLESISTQTDKALSEGKIKRHLYSSLSEELNSLQQELNSPINHFIESAINPRIEQKKSITKSDFIRIEIDRIIGINCGELPSQIEIEKINEEGEKRYASLIPPGFSDAQSKKGTSQFSNRTFTDKFGDLYLWKEVLGKASKCPGHNIIFVSDDSKKDWWYMHNGERIGPLESLQTEIYNCSEINNFRMISQSSFLFEAQKNLKGITVNQSSLEEVEKFSDNIDWNEHYYQDIDLKLEVINKEKTNTLTSSMINEFEDIHNTYISITDEFKKLEDRLDFSLKISKSFYKNDKQHPSLKNALRTYFNRAEMNKDELQSIFDSLSFFQRRNEIEKFINYFKEYEEYIHDCSGELFNNITKIESLLL